MIQNYLVKCKFTKEFTDGTLKRVTEQYIIQAVSFSDAETRAYKEVGEYVRGEFHITAIAIQNIADIFMFGDTDVIFIAGINYVSEDADSGKEKKINNKYLINAHTAQEAIERIEESLRGLMVKFEIGEVKKTKIVDIFFFEPESDEDETETVDENEEVLP